MIIYKGWHFTRLMDNRWRVTSANKNFSFDIIFKEGITELIQRVDLWMEVIYDNN